MSFKSLLPAYIIFLGLITLLTGCQNKGTDPSEQKNIDKTLSSLKKIDPFPFYTLTYYHDYHFDEFLQTGNLPQTPADLVTSHLENYQACSCIFAGGENTGLFGRNQDSWGRVTVALMVYTNPADGYASLSMVWTPCLDFDRNHLPDSSEFKENLLLAPYFPVDGMNEKGVAIANMSVPSADPPYDPRKITLNNPNIIRLVLDYARDVNEAVSLISHYNIDFFTGVGQDPIHYLIADASGNSAVIEFVHNQVKIIQDDNPWQVSTNFIISGVAIPEQVTCWRYIKAYNTLKECKGSMNQNEAMNLMQNVSEQGTTWSCIYDLINREVQVVINRQYQNVYSFSL